MSPLIAGVDNEHSSHQGEVLMLGSCSASVAEVETMLGLLARQVITSSNQL